MTPSLVQPEEKVRMAGPIPTGCCPPFPPAEWQEREVTWEDHPFVKEHVVSFFHIPLNMGRAVVRAKEKIDAAGASPEHPLWLAVENSLWGSELYVDVTRPVPGATLATLSGRFLTKVYDGPFGDIPLWTEDMKGYVERKGHTLDKLYFAYTTCPRCAKVYGHNYVVLFARIGDAAQPPAHAGALPESSDA